MTASQKTSPEIARLSTKAQSVRDAAASRFSCRAFLPTPVDAELLREMLKIASRAPSGGNLQPWRVWALSGAPLQNLISDIAVKAGENPRGEGSEYHIYPPDLTEPYHSRRADIGARMYELLGIGRDDRAGRFAQLAKNFNFFGAPCALFFAIDRQMQQGQWADLGMFMATLSLLVREAGLHSCAQESLAIWSATVRAHLEIPDNLIFFCAMAIGTADAEARVNRLVSPRVPLADFAQFIGFE